MLKACVKSTVDTRRLPVWFDEVTLIEVYLFSLVVRLPVWCSNLFIVVRCDYLDWGLPV